MIEFDVRVYLTEDATLDTLLGATADDDKIYTDEAPQDSERPYVVVYSQVGAPDENISEDLITFKIHADNAVDVRSIRDRIRTLLNVEDGIRAQITSTDYAIYYSKLVTGQSLPDKTDLSNIKYVIVSTYRMKFNNLT